MTLGTSKLPPVRELLTMAWKLVRATIAPLLILEGIALLPVLVVAAVAAPQLRTLALSGSGGGLLSIIVVLLVTCPLIIIFRISVWAGQVRLLDQKSSEGAMQAWKYGWRKFGTLLWYGFLLFIVSLPIFLLPLAVILLSFGIVGDSYRASFAFGIPLAALALLVVYIYIGTRLAFTLVLAALGEFEGSALRASWDLTKNKARAVFWALAGFGIMAFLLQIAVQIIAGFIGTAHVDVLAGAILLIGRSLIGVFGTAYLLVLLRQVQALPKNQE